MTTLPKPLFYRMLEGDEKMKGLGDENIVLMGMSRVGKSTLFNWLVRNTLKGVRRFAKIEYQTVMGDEEAAAVKGGNESVTLVPNIVALPNGLCVIDLPGFADSRDHIGVIGVSYMLKGVFQAGKKYKFVITTSENQFQEGGFLSTLKYFIEMFKFDTLEPELRQQLLNSICMLVTKCEQPGYITENLEPVKVDISSLTSTPPKTRQSLLAIIDHIIKSQKYHYFKCAVENANAPPC